MPNRLDDISRVIGNIEDELRALSASVAEVRHSAAGQHGENRQRLERIGARVEKIEADMKPLAKTVATMEPIVAGYAVARWKIAGAFCFGYDPYHHAWLDRVALRRQDYRLDIFCVSLGRPTCDVTPADGPALRSSTSGLQERQHKRSHGDQSDREVRMIWRACCFQHAC
jgi:hypothetical protein